MREIKFSGKRIDNGEWVYGYYFAEESIDAHYIKEISSCFQAENETFTDGEIITTEAYEVDPKTVRQYTGTKDDYDNEIYERDIVHLTSDDGIDYIALIVFRYGGFCAIDGTKDNYSFLRYDLSRCDLNVEVVGNIYDNPELLEVEK